MYLFLFCVLQIPMPENRGQSRLDARFNLNLSSRHHSRFPIFVAASSVSPTVKSSTSIVQTSSSHKHFSHMGEETQLLLMLCQLNSMEATKYSNSKTPSKSHDGHVITVLCIDGGTLTKFVIVVQLLDEHSKFKEAPM